VDPENPRDGTTRAGPDDNQRAQLAGLLRQLGITLTPIAKQTCDHAQREDRYRPSRKLQHIIRARTTTCPAPGCNAQAIYNEFGLWGNLWELFTDRDCRPMCGRAVTGMD
jgi:hypothetical protein